MSRTKTRETIQLIEDPELEPFFITKDEYSYAVKKRVIPNGDHFKTKSKESYDRTIGYFVSEEYALIKIFKLKKDENNHTNLQSYIDECKLINKQFEEYANKFRSNL
jgi:uncharacterized Rmd1/YagE family protein